MSIICHIADTHISERSQHATLDDQVAWLKPVGEEASEHGARILLHAGDLFDSDLALLRAWIAEERRLWPVRYFAHKNQILDIIEKLLERS